jgi:hypothetical protein
MFNYWVRVALVFLVAGFFATGVEGSTSMEQLASGINSPVLGVPIDLQEPLVFGRVTITPADGKSVNLLMSDQEVCGVFVSRGTLKYRIDDPISLPVAVRNLKTAADIEARPKNDVLELELPISGLAAWSWTLPKFEVQGSSSDGRETPLWVSETLDDPVFIRPGADMISARGEGSLGRAYILFQSGEATFQAMYRPEIEKVESLWILDQVKGFGNAFKEAFYRMELVTQPVGRPWFLPVAPPTVSEHTEIEVLTGDSDRGSVTTTTRLRAARKVGIWRVPFQVERTEDNRRFPNQIVAVKVNGEDAEWFLGRKDILVRFETPLESGQTAEVTISYEGKIAIQRGDYQFWYLGTWAWYPQPNLGGEHSTFKITLTVPEKFTPFASGVTTSQETKNGMTTLVTTLDQPMQFPVVAAGKYQIKEKTRDGYTCRVATYGTGNKKGVDRMIQNFFAAKEVYELLLGAPYPFKELTFIERNSWGFGQAPPGIIFITREAFETISDETRKYFSQGINERLIHEIAHGWWGHLVKMNSKEEQWISEGFAEYSAAVALELKRGGKKGQREFKSMVKHWQGDSKNLEEGSSLFLANHLANKSSDDSRDRWQMMYAKAPLVLHDLRLRLREKFGDDDRGDEVFFTMMRTMISSFPYGYGETRHMIGILNQLTGDDWSSWCMDYIFGTEVPDLD